MIFSLRTRARLIDSMTINFVLFLSREWSNPSRLWLTEKVQIQALRNLIWKNWVVLCFVTVLSKLDRKESLHPVIAIKSHKLMKSREDSFPTLNLMEVHRIQKNLPKVSKWIIAFEHFDTLFESSFRPLWKNKPQALIN